MKSIWIDYDDKIPPKGFPKVAKEDCAPRVIGNPITGTVDRLTTYSKEQKARRRRR